MEKSCLLSRICGRRVVLSVRSWAGTAGWRNATGAYRLCLPLGDEKAIRVTLASVDGFLVRYL